MCALEIACSRDKVISLWSLSGAGNRLGDFRPFTLAGSRCRARFWVGSGIASTGVSANKSIMEIFMRKDGLGISGAFQIRTDFDRVTLHRGFSTDPADPQGAGPGALSPHLCGWRSHVRRGAAWLRLRCPRSVRVAGWWRMTPARPAGNGFLEGPRCREPGRPGAARAWFQKRS